MKIDNSSRPLDGVVPTEYLVEPSWSRRIALARLTADEAGNLLNFCPFVRIRAMQTQSGA